MTSLVPILYASGRGGDYRGGRLAAPAAPAPPPPPPVLLTPPAAKHLSPSCTEQTVLVPLVQWWCCGSSNAVTVVTVVIVAQQYSSTDRQVVLDGLDGLDGLVVRSDIHSSLLHPHSPTRVSTPVPRIGEPVWPEPGSSPSIAWVFLYASAGYPRGQCGVGFLLSGQRVDDWLHLLPALFRTRVRRKGVWHWRSGDRGTFRIQITLLLRQSVPSHQKR